MNPFEDGKAKRKAVPRSAHSVWSAPADRSDPIGILQAQETTRVNSHLARNVQRLEREAASLIIAAKAK